MYRKLTATNIFDGYRILPANSVLITDDKGVIIDISDTNEAGDDIEFHEGLLSPGFINSHCHLELSHLKDAVPEKTGLVSFVQQVMTKRAAPSKSPPVGETSEELLDWKKNAMFIAEKEMYGSGIVAVGDICNTADSIPIKEKSNIRWYNFIEVSGFVDAFAEKRLLDAKAIQEKFSILNSQFSTIAPHAPYSVSKTLFQLINNETKNQLITIHNQECTAEDELYKNKSGKFLELFENFGIDITGFKATGKSSLQSYLPYFDNGQSLILVHNTFINEDDLKFIQSSVVGRQSSICFCLCPNANEYIESSKPPIDLLRKNNCSIVIGTDSLASNHQLSIVEEIKTIQKINPEIPLEEMLQWATSNSSKALQMDGVLGSFEKGKRPGVVLIDNLKDGKLTTESKSKNLFI